MNKSDLEFLKLIVESIKGTHELTEEMFTQMYEARSEIIDKYGIECYEVLEELATTIAIVSGKLDFLDDVLTRFVNDIEESEG